MARCVSRPSSQRRLRDSTGGCARAALANLVLAAPSPIIGKRRSARTGQRSRGEGPDRPNVSSACRPAHSREETTLETERRRSVGMVRDFRRVEGPSIAQIANGQGRSPATVKVYLYDPTCQKALAVKALYQGWLATPAGLLNEATVRGSAVAQLHDRAAADVPARARVEDAHRADELRVGVRPGFAICRKSSNLPRTHSR